MNTPAADFPTSRRKGMMALLVSAFVLQTYLVYSDDTGRDLPPLSDEALEGRAVWLSNKGCVPLLISCDLTEPGMISPDSSNRSPAGIFHLPCV